MNRAGRFWVDRCIYCCIPLRRVGSYANHLDVHRFSPPFKASKHRYGR